MPSIQTYKGLHFKISAIIINKCAFGSDSEGDDIILINVTKYSDIHMTHWRKQYKECVTLPSKSIA